MAATCRCQPMAFSYLPLHFRLARPPCPRAVLPGELMHSQPTSLPSWTFKVATVASRPSYVYRQTTCRCIEGAISCPMKHEGSGVSTWGINDDSLAVSPRSEPRCQSLQATPSCWEGVISSIVGLASRRLEEKARIRHEHLRSLVTNKFLGCVFSGNARQHDFHGCTRRSLATFARKVKSAKLTETCTVLKVRLSDLRAVCALAPGYTTFLVCMPVYRFGLSWPRDLCSEASGRYHWVSLDM